MGPGGGGAVSLAHRCHELGGLSWAEVKVTWPKVWQAVVSLGGGPAPGWWAPMGAAPQLWVLGRQWGAHACVHIHVCESGCVCMHVRLHTSVCTSICARVDVCAQRWPCTFACSAVCRWVSCLSVCVCTLTELHVQAWVCTHVCVTTYMCVHVHMCTHAHVCAEVALHICMCSGVRAGVVPTRVCVHTYRAPRASTGVFARVHDCMDVHGCTFMRVQTCMHA